MPALFLAGALAAAALVGDVFAVDDTAARALLVDSDLVLAAAFFAAGFFFGAASSPSAALAVVFLALAGFAAYLGFLPPPLAARSSISAIACGSVTVSFSNSAGIVALTPPAVT